jgi:hypothetical protein
MLRIAVTTLCVLAFAQTGQAQEAEAADKTVKAEATKPEAVDPKKDAKADKKADAKDEKKEAADGKAKPVDTKAKPADGDAKPADGDAKPADGDAKPADGDAKPADGDAKPADGDAKPADGDAKPADGDKEKKEPVEKLPFIKGDLTSAGANVRIPPRSEYGVRLGVDTIGEDIFLKVSPQIHLIKKRWRLGFHLPLRAPLYSTRAEVSTLLSDQTFTIRQEDYDQAEDFIAAILYAQYGNKEDPVYLSVSRVGAASLGHGTVMRRFNPNLTTDTTYTSVGLDAYTKHGGFQAFASSVPNPYLWGVLGFIKPVGAISDADPAKSPAGLRSLSVGLVHVQDREAPESLNRNGSLLNLDIDNGYLPIVDSAGAVSATGVSAEYKFYKSADAKTDLKAYLDISNLGIENGASGMGYSMGGLARLNFGSGKNTTAMRLRLEGRMFEAGFVPTYFDSLYAQQRYQFASVSDADGNLSTPTKMVWLNGLTSGADADKMRMGYFVDWAYAKPQAYGLQVSYENASIQGGSSDDNRYQHLMVHAEMPLLFLEVFGTYHLRGFGTFDEAFKLEQDNEILVGAVRWKLFPFLAFNVRAQKNFSTASYGSGVNSQIRQSSIEGGFKNVWDYGVDCQIGAHY